MTSRPADTSFHACSSRRRIRLQADVIIDRMVKTLLATSPELKRGRAGTESDRVHLPLDDTIAHRSFSNRRCHRWQPTTFRVCFHDRPMTLGVKPCPQIMAALLIDCSNGPEVMPARTVQFSSAVRYRATTVLLKASLGSEQYQSMNSRIA
jgi:hypothetical protein